MPSREEREDEMGLDMYLSAKKVLDEETAERVLEALGITAAELEARSGLDPMEHETTLYLPMWEHYADEERGRVVAALTAAGMVEMVHPDSPSGRLSWKDGHVVVSVHAMYWRKANAIHAWFVTNCQDGVDECQESDDVSAEQLAHLAHLCTEALGAYNAGDLQRAGEIMAPQGGFFFGSTDIDEWWAQDLTDTVTGVELAVRRAIAVGGVTFNYQSSW